MLTPMACLMSLLRQYSEEWNLPPAKVVDKYIALCSQRSVIVPARDVADLRAAAKVMESAPSET